MPLVVKLAPVTFPLEVKLVRVPTPVIFPCVAFVTVPAVVALVAAPLKAPTNVVAVIEAFAKLALMLVLNTAAELPFALLVVNLGYTVVEVDVTKIAQLRQKVQSAFVAKSGGKLNFMPFFALAAAEALRVHPKLNATIDGDNIVYPGHENVSIAVDTERGLLTPVVKNAGELNIAQYSIAIADVAARTRDNKLQPDELAGGTFTLTNTGSRGALFDTPVVFLPQLAILGTGVVTKRPVVIEAEGQEVIAVRSMVYLALSYDHRIIDGADAARFLGAIKERLEEGAFEADLGI